MADQQERTASSETVSSYETMSPADNITLEDAASMDKKIKSGSVLDLTGYATNSASPDYARNIISKFVEQGIAKYLSFDYRRWYKEAVAEFYSYRQVRKDKQQIKSQIKGRKVHINSKMIGEAFEIPSRPDAAKDFSGHKYDKKGFWEEIKSDKAPTNYPSARTTFKKNWLKEEVKEVIDILHKNVVPKVSGTDDGSMETLDILHGILHSYKIDWSDFIYGQLLKFVTENVQGGSITTTVGFGNLIGHLVKSQGADVGSGTALHPNCYMFRQPKHSGKTKATEPAPKEKRKQKEEKTKDEKKGKKKEKVMAVEKEQIAGTARGIEEPSSQSLPIAQQPEQTASRTDEDKDEDGAPLIQMMRKSASTSTPVVRAVAPIIDIDEELARQFEAEIEEEEVEKAQIDTDKIFVDYIRVKRWAEWKFLNTPQQLLDVIKMIREEEYALRWLGCEQAKDALAPGRIDQEFETRKSGKGKDPIDQDTAEETDEQRKAREKEELRRAQFLSRLNEEFRDRRPDVGTSGLARQPEVIILDEEDEPVAQKAAPPNIEGILNEPVDVAAEVPEEERLHVEGELAAEQMISQDDPMEREEQIEGVPRTSEEREVPAPKEREEEIQDEETLTEKEGFLTHISPGFNVDAGTSYTPVAQHPDPVYLDVLNSILAEHNQKLDTIEKAVRAVANREVMQEMITIQLNKHREAQSAELIKKISQDGQLTRDFVPAAMEKIMFEAFKEIKDFIKEAKEMKLLQRFAVVEDKILKNWELTKEMRQNQADLAHNQFILKKDIGGVGKHLHAIGDGVSFISAGIIDAKKGEETPFVNPTLEQTEDLRIPPPIELSSSTSKPLRRLPEGPPLDKEERKRRRVEKAQSQVLLPEEERERTQSLGIVNSIKLSSDHISAEDMAHFLNRMIKAHKLKLHSGRTAEECVRWWLSEVLDGLTLLDAWSHYVSGIFSERWKNIADPVDVEKTREIINQLLNKADEDAAHKKAKM